MITKVLSVVKTSLSTKRHVIRFRVRELLDEADVGQRELARVAGVSYPVVNRLCAPPDGQPRQIALETLERVARALGVTPCDLFTYAPDR